MKRIIGSILLVSLVFVVISFVAKEKKEKPLVIAYYESGIEAIDRYDVKQLDQIIFSFMHLKGNRLTIDNEKDDQVVQKLVGKKKENPNLKVLLSLGGWGGCETCSAIFSSEKNRKAFAKSVLKMLKVYGADGIDLDWEYPAIEGLPGHQFLPEDKDNFTALIQELRKQLGQDYIISFAAGAHEAYLEKSIDWEKVVPLVNNINLMTYDLVNGYSTRTGHHTALFSTDSQQISTDWSIKQLIQKGVPAKKIVLGSAFYGRVWAGVDSKNNGLYQAGKFHAFVPFKELSNQLKDDFEEHWDSTACAPYAYNSKKKLFATYDNRASVKCKMEYLKKQGLGGVMFWSLNHDLNQGLLQVIDQNK